MVEKLNMHIWSTTPAISSNTEQLQAKMNELIDVINDMKKEKVSIIKCKKCKSFVFEKDGKTCVKCGAVC